MTDTPRPRLVSHCCGSAQGQHEAAKDGEREPSRAPQPRAPQSHPAQRASEGPSSREVCSRGSHAVQGATTAWPSAGTAPPAVGLGRAR